VRRPPSLKGVAFITFDPPRHGFDGGPADTVKSDGPILWNRRRDRACVRIVSRVFATDGFESVWFDLELRRFGREWIVVREDESETE
jgi:hypothetical protein